MTALEAKAALRSVQAERIENISIAMRCKKRGDLAGFRRCKELCNHLQREAARLLTIIKAEELT